MNVKPDGKAYLRWQDFQRWLSMGNCNVTIPYAEVLAQLISPKAVRLRRDFSQIILAIKAHALLHRDRQRFVDDDGRRPCHHDRSEGGRPHDPHGARVVMDYHSSIHRNPAAAYVPSELRRSNDAVADTRLNRLGPSACIRSSWMWWRSAGCRLI
jgi:hypothetical protein